MSLLTISRHVNDVMAHVKRQFGDESGVQITDADIIRWINQAQLEISNLADPIQAKSASVSVIGQYEYQLPSEKTTKIVTLHVSGRPIESLDFQTAEQVIVSQDPERISTGFPQVWWRFANNIYFWPTPDAVYPFELYYYKAPDDVLAAADFLGLPDKYYEAILQFVMSKAYELDEEFGEARAAMAEFSSRLGLTLEEDSYSSVDFYPSITVVDD